MSNYFESLPKQIQNHLKSLLPATGLSNTPDSYEKMAVGWSEKEQKFKAEIEKRKLLEINELELSDTRAAVALTYSGSLMLLGPVIDGARKIAYSSIGMRRDVPESAMRENSKLAKEVRVDHPIELEIGPIQKSSPIFKIAVCNYELAPAEQDEVITEATIALTEQFVDVNKTMIL
ncbi:MAG: hypothetical protein ACI86H_003047 [bacterium]|jgi:hypothetical protein